MNTNLDDRDKADGPELLVYLLYIQTNCNQTLQ